MSTRLTCVKTLNSRFGRETDVFSLEWNLVASETEKGICIRHCDSVASVDVKSVMAEQLEPEYWDQIVQYRPSNQRVVRGGGRLFRVIMIGNSNAGKTTLVGTLSGDSVSEKRPTISVDLKIVYHDEHQFQIWDTAGQERFQSIVKSYYRDLSTALLVFDVTDRSSFDAVENWLNQLKEFSDRPYDSIHRVLVGNKIDLANSRVVSHSEAFKCAKQRGMIYMETCAHNVDDVATLYTRTFEFLIKSHDASYVRHGGVTLAARPAPVPAASYCC